jgi:thioredoxin 1
MKKLVLLALLAANLCCGCAHSQAQSGSGEAGATPVLETTTAKFKQDVLSSTDKPVLVDFYATWCGPCRAMSPIVDKVADKYKDKLKVFRVDIDKNPELANALRIESIPLLAVFKNGKVATAAIGQMPEQELDALVEKVLAP